MEKFNPSIEKEFEITIPKLTFRPDKRVIDITYGELIQGLVNDLVAELLDKLMPVPSLESKVHPDTGLPEGPEDEVDSTRAREILRSESNPVSVPYLNKLRKKPDFDASGRNVGGAGIPFKLISRRAMYKVKDLLAFRSNPKHFVK